MDEELDVLLWDGKVVADEELKKVIRRLKAEEPEKLVNRINGTEWSEMGMGEAFARCFHGSILYCTTNKAWYVYQGGRWVYDNSSVIIDKKLKDFVRICRLYGETIKDEKTRDDWFSFVLKMQDRRFRDRMRKDAESEASISMELFDANPYLINCKNGTYDLKTRRFREHNPEDFLTMQTNFSYTFSRERPRCARWEQFISQITEGNAEKAQYIQKSYGYAMMGIASAECMFIWWGKTSRNGKSTLQNTIEGMMGDYSAVAPVSIICKNGKTDTAATASPMLAMLKGKRIVTMAESADYGKLDEQIIKSMTGGENITARKLYSEPMTFLPQFTLFLSTNTLPAVSDKSIFASDRLRVVEFTKHFGEEERDDTLKTQFSEEDAMRGIFTWLLDGYDLYCAEGLRLSSEMRKVVQQYEKDNDVVLQFLSEKTRRSENGRIRLKTLYEYFKVWCGANGYRAMSTRAFAKNLDRLVEFYENIVKPQGAVTFTGIEIIEE